MKSGFILAAHKWRVGSDGKPLKREFTRSAWNRLPPYTGTDPKDETGVGGTVKIDRQGWEQITEGQLVEPQAAKEAKAAAEADEPAKPAEETETKSTRRRRGRPAKK